MRRDFAACGSKGFECLGGIGNAQAVASKQPERMTCMLLVVCCLLFVHGLLLFVNNAIQTHAIT